MYTLRWLTFAAALLAIGSASSANGAQTSDCISALVHLSGIPHADRNRTVEIFRTNAIDQALFDDSERFEDASYLLSDLGITSAVNRFKIFKCLNRESSHNSLCRWKSPCNMGLCVYGASGNYECQCLPGFTGSTCQTELNECDLRKPCLNGGTCHDHVNNFTCTCPEGFYGRLCEADRNECASQPCVNGVCTDVINGYTCQCQSGYTGTVCDEDIDDCVSFPCQHGVCVDRLNGYECQCEPGYTGEHCDTDIDECASQPCARTGTCQDGINNYTCLCSLGYDGHRCDNQWLTRETYAEHRKKDSGSSGKIVYTRWGRRSCPASAQLLYSGYAANGHYSTKGGGANALCLTSDPVYDVYPSTWGAVVHGITYSLSGKSQPYNGYSLSGQAAPCAVCITNKSAKLMIPATNECPQNWNREYYGYLMAPHYSSSTYRGEHLCFDNAIEGRGNQGTGHSVTTAQVEVGNGLRGSYVSRKDLTCAVCTI